METRKGDHCSWCESITLNTWGRECHLNPFSACPGEDAQRKRRQVQHRGPRGTQPTTASPDSCSTQAMTALILTGAKRLQISLPSKGGVKACPQVVIACQGCQRTGRVAVALVQEGREGRVHPLGALWAAKLLCLKHLKCRGKGWSLNRTMTAEQRRASSFIANFPAPAPEDSVPFCCPDAQKVPVVSSFQTEWFLPHSLITSHRFLLYPIPQPTCRAPAGTQEAHMLAWPLLLFSTYFQSSPVPAHGGFHCKTLCVCLGAGVDMCPILALR